MGNFFGPDICEIARQGDIEQLEKILFEKGKVSLDEFDDVCENFIIHIFELKTNFKLK